VPCSRLRGHVVDFLVISYARDKRGHGTDLSATETIGECLSARICERVVPIRYRKSDFVLCGIVVAASMADQDDPHQKIHVFSWRFFQ
jgi:hypothetical protein